MPQSSPKALAATIAASPVTLEAGTAIVPVRDRPNARAIADADGYSEVALVVDGDGELARIKGHRNTLRVALFRMLDALERAERDVLGNRRGHGAS